MKNILLVIPLVVLLTPFTMGITQQQAPTERPYTMPHMPMMQQGSCPMQIQGTELSIDDVPGGIALTMTTKTGDVAQLRLRIESMAKMHAASAGAGIPGARMHGNNIPFSVKYEEVSNGARLMLTPQDPAKLDEFRVRIREHAEQMKKGNCSMMQGMMNNRPPSVKE